MVQIVEKQQCKYVETRNKTTHNYCRDQKTYHTTYCTIKTRDKKNTINQPNISFIFYMDIAIDIT